MKSQIDSKELYEAFLKGKLGTDEFFPLWTPLWALRSRIWRKKRFRKMARETFGDLALEAIDSGEPESLRDLAAALEYMMAFERDPANAVLADVYYAVEELNGSYTEFSRADLMKWLNEQMDAVVTVDEVDGALETLGLSGAVPKGKRKMNW